MAKSTKRADLRAKSFESPNVSAQKEISKLLKPDLAKLGKSLRKEVEDDVDFSEACCFALGVPG